MAKKEQLRGRREESLFIAERVNEIGPRERVFLEPVTRLPLRSQQWRLIFEAFGGVTPELKAFLRETSEDPRFHGLTRGELLLEYTTAVLSRDLCELEITLHRQGKIQFAIPGFGHEALGVAIERYARPTDAVYPYYRQEANDLMRGGTVKELMAMTAQKVGDTHGGGRVLAGHPASSWRGELPVISNVAANVLTAVGVAQGLKLRREQGATENWSRFEASDAIAICHIGDAAMAEGEAAEGIAEMVKDGGCPMLLVVHNNGSGISTDVNEGSIDGDPIVAALGYVAHGLKIFEVDGTDIQALFDTCAEAVSWTRENYAPAVLHVFNLYKRTHSSSDDPARYIAPSELVERERLDPIPLLRKYLIESGVVEASTLDAIESLAQSTVQSDIESVLASADPDPESLYDNVYAGGFSYGPVQMKDIHPLAVGSKDLLGSSRESHVDYLEETATGSQVLNLRQHITTVIAEEMQRDDRIIVYGEDVADFSTKSWKGLPNYLEERIEERRGEFSEAQIETALQLLPLIQRGEGHLIPAEDFALLVDLRGGKGGVFKMTQFLKLLFGEHRVWNSRLAEASIIGTAVGQAIDGYVPIVEIQFDAYLSPGYQQLVDQLSTLRWRSDGQFSAGMVIRIQGLNRLGGVGGIGHGDVILGKLINIPGVRVVVPGDASEAGPLMRESIRLAQEHGEPVIFYEPIMEMNANLGYYQGNDSHLPLGEAQVRDRGEDFLVLTYGNNIPLVEKAQEKWMQSGVSATIINLRTLGTATDWATIAPWIDKHGKVLIVETERGEGSAGANLSAQISEHFFQLLDAPVKRISARNFRTPAGRKNEDYALPQMKDIISAGLELAAY